MKKKILITGAAGFLGQLAIEYYKKKYDLLLVDRYKLEHKDFHSIDISDYNKINNLIKKKKPDIILHYASEIFDTFNKKKINSNVTGTFNLIKSATNNNIKNFIFTSTFSLFEKNYSNLIDEIEPISCKNLYGFSKAEAERILLSSNKNLNITIFRCPIVVEKSRAHRLGVLFEFLKDDCSLWLLGKGNNKLQFVSAIDLFHMTEKSLKLKGHNIFNIGTENVLTLKEIYKFLIRKTNSKSKIKHLNKFFGLFILKILVFLRLINWNDYHNKLLISSIVLDITRIKKILNYKPKKSNAELLLEAYNHYIKNKKIPEFGSGKKPKMGFFRIIKYFSKFI